MYCFDQRSKKLIIARLITSDFRGLRFPYLVPCLTSPATFEAFTDICLFTRFLFHYPTWTLHQLIQIN